jgi:Amidohydrolase family
VTGNPDQVRGIVRALKQVGVDFIKVHRRVPRDSYFAIIDEAKKQGLTVVGHIPMTVRPEEASDAGQLIEHEETLFEGIFAAGLTAAQLPDAIHQFLASGAADTLFARFVRNRTPVTSTLTAWRYLIEHPDTSWLSDPRMRYVARSLKEAARRAPAVSAEELPVVKRTVAAYREVLGQMNRSGVIILAGSDIGGARIPGFSLHDELVTLADAGLTPLQALRAATLNPSRILNKEGDFGSVTPGKRADLVLLDADPLDDIHNTQRITAVVLGGKLLRRADLDELLRTGEEMASKN